MCVYQTKMPRVVTLVQLFPGLMGGEVPEPEDDVLTSEASIASQVASMVQTLSLCIMKTREYESTGGRNLLWVVLLSLVGTKALDEGETQKLYRQRTVAQKFLSMELHPVPLPYGVLIVTRRKDQINFNIAVAKKSSMMTCLINQGIQHFIESNPMCRINLEPLCSHIPELIFAMELSNETHRARFLTKRVHISQLHYDVERNAVAFRGVLQPVDVKLEDPSKIKFFKPLNLFDMEDPNDQQYWVKIKGHLVVIRNARLQLCHPLCFPQEVDLMDLLPNLMGPDVYKVYAGLYLPETRETVSRAISVSWIPDVLRNTLFHVGMKVFGLCDEHIRLSPSVFRDFRLAEPMVRHMASLYESEQAVLMAYDDVLVRRFGAALEHLSEYQSFLQWVAKSDMVRRVMEQIPYHSVRMLLRYIGGLRNTLSTMLTTTTMEPERNAMFRRILSEDCMERCQDRRVAMETYQRVAHQITQEAMASADEKKAPSKEEEEVGSGPTTRRRKGGKKKPKTAEKRGEAAARRHMRERESRDKEAYKEGSSSLQATPSSITPCHLNEDLEEDTDPSDPSLDLPLVVPQEDDRDAVLERLQTQLLDPTWSVALIGSSIHFASANDMDIVICVPEAETLEEAYEKVRTRTGWDPQYDCITGEHVAVLHGVFENQLMDAQVWRGAADASVAEAETARALALAERMRTHTDACCRRHVQLLHRWAESAQLKGHRLGKLPGVAITCMAIVASCQVHDRSTEGENEDVNVLPLLNALCAMCVQSAPVVDFDNLCDHGRTTCHTRASEALKVVVDERNVANRLTRGSTRHIGEILTFAVNNASLLRRNVSFFDGTIYESWRNEHMILCARLRAVDAKALSHTLGAALKRLDGHPLIDTFHVGDATDADGKTVVEVRVTLHASAPLDRYGLREDDRVQPLPGRPIEGNQHVCHCLWQVQRRHHTWPIVATQWNHRRGVDWNARVSVRDCVSLRGEDGAFTRYPMRLLYASMR